MAACASPPPKDTGLPAPEPDLTAWRLWARDVDWWNVQECGGHPGLADTPELMAWVKDVEGRWLTIAVDTPRRDDRPLRPGMSLPIVTLPSYKGDAVVREVLDGGAILRAWHHNPVPGIDVEVGDMAMTRALARFLVGPDSPPAIPDLKGHVTAVDGRTVDIQVTHNPTRAPMQLGYQFAIHVGNTYKGDVVVKEFLGPDLVRGQVYNPVRGTTILVGDKAATQVP